METLEKQMVLMSKLVTAVREAASAALQSDTAVLERLTDVCQEEERQQTETLHPCPSSNEGRGAAGGA